MSCVQVPCALSLVATAVLLTYLLARTHYYTHAYLLAIIAWLIYHLFTIIDYLCTWSIRIFFITTASLKLNLKTNIYRPEYWLSNKFCMIAKQVFKFIPVGGRFIFQNRLLLLYRQVCITIWCGIILRILPWWRWEFIPSGGHHPWSETSVPAWSCSWPKGPWS